MNTDDEQLRAKVEGLAASWADLLRTESEIMTTPQRNAWKDALAELRHVVLGEPFAPVRSGGSCDPGDEGE